MYALSMTYAGRHNRSVRIVASADGISDNSQGHDSNGTMVAVTISLNHTGGRLLLFIIFVFICDTYRLQR